MSRILLVTTAALLLALPCAAQEKGEPEPKADAAWAAKAVERGVAALVKMQEGEGSGEWPYEGVYSWGRDPETRGKIIPIGYRVGGTAIGALALLEAPGLEKDTARMEAIRRALDFVVAGNRHEKMAEGFNERRYDVRGWGHAYSLLFLLRLQDLDLVPEESRTAVSNTTKWLVNVLQRMAIPKRGGWNYSLPNGFGNPRNAASPFMTGPTLQALFHAKARGHEVADKVVVEALDALERARTASGGYAYSASRNVNDVTEEEMARTRGGGAPRGMMDRKPGAIGRMCVVEATLMLTPDRGDVGRLRDAVSSFFEHWDALKVRKQQQGTHIPPYGVAPYYFMYAHYYAAQAIEFLPEEAEREAARAKLRAVLAKEEESEGGWNDRVFPRSRNYGSALGVMALVMKDVPRTPQWKGATREKRSDEDEAKQGR